MRGEIEATEGVKFMSKVLALQLPSKQLYKMIMSYCLAVIAGHLPECTNDKATKIAVLILDYLETRDSFIYVQTLDILLKGHSQKQKLLEKIEQIEIDQLGKAREKMVTVDSGVAHDESVPVLLALYHRKKTVKKAALLSLYQQWVDKDNIIKGKDLRMISSMLVQFIEDDESEDIMVVTITLLSYLATKGLLSDVLTLKLYKVLSGQFFISHFPPNRQYSNEAYIKAINLCLSLKVPSVHQNYNFLIFLACQSDPNLASKLVISKDSELIYSFYQHKQNNKEGKLSNLSVQNSQFIR